jgi:hypothetical protein
MKCAHQHTIFLGTCYWCLTCRILVTRPYGEAVADIPFTCTDSECPSFGTEMCTQAMQSKVIAKEAVAISE